jgi:hypothetical protein
VDNLTRHNLALLRPFADWSAVLASMNADLALLKWLTGVHVEGLGNVQQSLLSDMSKTTVKTLQCGCGRGNGEGTVNTP